MPARYHRFFIILHPVEANFELFRGKKPAGYCKMEVKKSGARVTLYVQGLKPAEHLDGVYELFLVAGGSKVFLYRLTQVQVNEKGRGQCTVELDANDVQHFGCSVDSFDAVAVVFRPLKHIETFRVQYPLVGTVRKRKEVDWSGKIAKELERFYRREVFYKGKAVPDKQIYRSTDEGEKLKVEKSSGTVQTVVQDETSEPADKETDNRMVARSEEKAEHEKRKISMNTESEAGGNSFRDAGGRYWDKVKDYFTELFKEHKTVQPFNYDIGDSEWIRINRTGSGYSSYYIGTARMSYFPGYACYDHYIVGIIRKNGRVRYVAYGIPGFYGVMPPIGMPGFYRWMPAKNVPGLGYWLIFIDADTGGVAYPPLK